MRLAFLIVSLLLAGPAGAETCKNPLYVLDEKNVLMRGQPASTIVLNETEAILTVSGKTVVYSVTRTPNGKLGYAKHPTDPDEFPTFVIHDISDRVKPGQPDHFLIFGDSLYWPTCRAVS